VQAAGGTPLNADETGSRRRRRIRTLAAIAAAVYAIDLVTKTIVVKTLEGGEPLRLIGDFVQLRVIRNSGAAFSIGTGMTVVFTLIATIVVLAILRTARQLRSLPWAITLGLLLGGALGNLTDRIFRAPSPFQGHVVDFISVGNYPVFNAGDSAIVCGGALAVFLAWRGYQIDGTRQQETKDSAENPKHDTSTRDPDPATRPGSDAGGAPGADLDGVRAGDKGAGAASYGAVDGARGADSGGAVSDRVRGGDVGAEGASGDGADEARSARSGRGQGGADTVRGGDSGGARGAVPGESRGSDGSGR
jgi:signal peptidase II